jgi:hypothetical protein
MEVGEDSGYSVAVKQAVMALVLLVSLCAARLLSAQTVPPNRSPNGDQSLQMTRIGDGYMFGRHAAFRTYETPDHTEGLVWYGEFRSEQEAKLATKLSLKGHRVTGKEQVRDLNGHVIGNRIVAASKQQKKAFMVIRTHELQYWIIQSISLVVAMQLDGLIEPPPLPALAQDRKNPSSCDRSSEFFSKQQQLYKEEQQKVHQIRAQGLVKVLVNADGEVVDAKVIQVSAGSADVLVSQARSMKFKSRPGCGTADIAMSFAVQGN